MVKPVGQDRRTSSGPKKHVLHALCPYFAMFPHTFARQQILQHTKLGDIVLDPFSGRGTTLLESRLLGRPAVALDINPVAALVTGAKAEIPQLHSVEQRLYELEREYGESEKAALIE